jgi:DNA-binding GntR family transcriptional regulator
MAPATAHPLSERPGGPDKPLNLSNRIYEDIKSRIIEVRLAPDAVLDERSLAGELGASRTPVREALRRLALEGWVVWPERRQACVRGITPDDAAEIFSVRDMLEVYAITVIFDSKEPRFLAGQLVPLANQMRERAEERVAFIKADMAFHSQIINHAGNSRLCGLWDRIAGEVMRIAIYTLSGGRNPRTIHNEHEALIEGFWSADRELTIREMRKHHEMIIRAYQIRLGY